MDVRGRYIHTPRSHRLSLYACSHSHCSHYNNAMIVLTRERKKKEITNHSKNMKTNQRQNTQTFFGLDFRYQIYSDSTFRKANKKTELLPSLKQLPLNSYHTHFFINFLSFVLLGIQQSLIVGCVCFFCCIRFYLVGSALRSYVEYKYLYIVVACSK